MKITHNNSLSEIQKQFWLHQSLHENTSLYNLVSLFRIDNGVIDVNILRGTIEQILLKHELLSKNINHEINIESRNFSEESLRYEINRVIDIDKDPLIRIILFKDQVNQFLLFIFHHIIFDLHSKDLFARDFSSIYNALQDGKKPLIEPPVSYNEYTRWYSQFVQTEKYSKQIEYWRNEPLNRGLLNLPSDYDRQPFPSAKGKRIYSKISRGKTEKLLAYTQRNNTDPFLVLLTVYSIFLYRFSNQRDISIGIPRTNRPQENFSDVIGCFVNILPLCLKFSEGLTFSKLLRQIRMKMLGMHRNQNVSYLEVAGLAGEGVDKKYNSLFQVGFTFEHPMKLDLNDLDIKPVNAAPDAAQLDLFFYFWKDGDRFHWAVEYCSELFKEESIHSFMAVYETILDRVFESENFDIQTVSLVDEKTINTLQGWNQTEIPFDYDGGVQKLIADKAQQFTDLPALIYENDQLTYGELLHRASAVARFLLDKGVEKEGIIGLSMERSFEMVIAMYGIVLAGCTYLPIEPALPQDYIDYILKDSETPIVIAKEAYRGLYPQQIDFVALDTFDYSASEVELPHVMSHDRIYILYTSGSTGRPKGVEITHQGLLNRLLWMDGEYELRSDDVLLQKTPYNFDVSGWEFWWPLIKGVPLVIAEPEGHKDNNYLIETIKREKVSIIHFVPSMLREFLKTCDIGDCPSLRDVICSGEALPPVVVREFYKTLPHVQLHNLYGPTEASIDVTNWSCSPDCKVVPIGKPVANTKIYILDDSLNLLPPGVAGEVYLSGVQLARGYLNKPELTAERFISNPYEEGLMYKTGDLGQWNLQGEVLFLGRNDNQIQLHGQRIELGEVESHINNHNCVDKAVVTIHWDFGADQSLIAYVVLKKDLTADELISYLSLHLPSHMVPKRIVFVKDIPLNANGKIDRKKLPDPGKILKTLNKSISMPKGDREIFIADLWKKMLNLDQIGREENFFELGGSSLHIVQLQRELSVQFDRLIPITDLFIYTSVKSLAGYLDDRDTGISETGKLTDRAERSRNAIQRLKIKRKR